MMKPLAKSSLLIWNKRLLITRPKLLLPQSSERIPLKLLKKLKRKLDKSLGMLNKTKTALLLKVLFVNNNILLGKRRMLNMLTKLKLLMKLPRLSNTFKPVLLSHKSRADLKRSKPSSLKVNMLSSSP